MSKNKYRLNHLLFLILLVLFQSCESQTKGNPKYIGEKYGSFNLDKSTFTENIDTLFSKISHVEIKKNINERKMRVFRVKFNNQKKELFKYFNIQDGGTEFYLDDKNNLIKIYNMVRTTKSQSDDFMKQLRKKYVSYEIKSEKNKFIDDIFIGIIKNKLIHITKTCINEGTYKGECLIIYNIYKYPQKDEDIIRFMTPYSIEIENLLKK